MDVGAWLRNLGLGQYEGAFRDNSVDAELLPRLTSEDLKELGVASVGHKRKLLDAISDLRSVRGAPATWAAPTSSPSLARPSALRADSAERRPITVMFCDLVGSTNLAAKLDAEDWRSLVNAYLGEASKAVTGLGGHVLKRLGDGLMALFGYPHAQENDAERATRAALAILRALEDLNAKNGDKGLPALVARIGLESGPVVVDATGEVFGDSPNIAARVQALAEPGTVLVTSNIQRQIAGLFVAEDKGPHELKGVGAPVTLYRVVRASGGGRRTGARVLTPLIGREEDLALIERRWERARAGDGQFIFIVGEPGIGKSRIIEEFHARLGGAPYTWVEWSSSQLLQNTPLHPIAEWGRQRFGADVPAEQRVADIENTLRLVGLDPAEYTPLLAPLVGIPLTEDRAANLAPEELRRRQLTAMAAWLLAGARTQPVILTFEDLHWADPTSLDLVRALAERGEQAPLFVIVTARPEFRPSWGIRPHHGVVALAPLDRKQVRRMVCEIAAQHALPEDVIDRLGERTGGVPLFVEEVTRLLLERGESRDARAIPPTLQQSLAARLDRLGTAREVAQIGAVLGRDFSYALLREVGGLDEPALQSALDRLTEADLLFVEGVPPDAAYRFKHALIRDAAYESLLKSQRGALHRRAAETLVKRGAQPEAIAQHFAEAGLEDLAIDWWQKAAELALNRSAHAEADKCAGSGLALAERLKGPERQPRELTLLITRANALRALKGFNTPETVTVLIAAKELTDSGVGTPAQHFSVLHGLCSARHTGAQIDAALALADEMLEVARRHDDPTFRMIGHRVLGMLQLAVGQNRKALAAFQEAEGHYEAQSQKPFAYRFGSDPGLNVLNYKIWALAILGLLREAANARSQVVATLQSQEHSPTAAGCIYWAKVWPNFLWGDLEACERHATELVAYSEERGVEIFRALGAVHGAFARAMRDPGQERARAVEAAIAGWHRTGARLFDSVHMCQLAESYLMVGDVARAQAALNEAFSFVEKSGERFWLAELHRLEGRVTLKRTKSDQGQAEICFRKAIEVAHSQEVRLLELRAATDLAGLTRIVGSADGPRAILGPLLATIEGGEDLKDVREARALLSTLAE
jgi:class 3 adenylate cyclase/tetratricopeptide (TPR) repeat protein